MRRVVQLLAVAVALVALGALAVVPGAAAPVDDDTAGGPALADGHVGECAVTPPSDHADPANPDGVIGWVEGYWYNEPVSVTPDDGFNQSELDRLARRTAAQVESLRCLDYVDGLPPLQTISRDQYRENVAGQVENQTTAEGELYENAQYAARMTIGSEVDALEAFVDAQAAFPAAFYRPDQDYMAFVTDDETVEGLRQSTLAHELVHALQDQYFDVGAIFEKPTNDQYLAAASVVESDAQFFQEQYTANCNSGSWADDCITPARGTPPEIPNWAIALNQQFQYTSPLIEATYEEGGTEAIDNLFGNFPETTTESIYSDRFGEFETADITVEDQSGSAWRRVQSGNLSYNTIGQAGMTAMFIAPYYETDGSTNVVSDIREFIPQRGVLDYGIPETDGWRGDKLYGYADDANETGAVWDSAWDSSTDAEEFASTYEALMEHRGGTLASGYENVYTFDTEEYDMAAAVTQTDERVLIVTAPTVEDLTGVHESVSLQSTDTDDSDSDTGNGDESDDSGGDGGDGSAAETDDGETSDDGGSDDGSSDDGGPGFGILAAAVAVLGAGFWLARR